MGGHFLSGLPYIQQSVVSCKGTSEQLGDISRQEGFSVAGHLPEHLRGGERLTRWQDISHIKSQSCRIYRSFNLLLEGNSHLNSKLELAIIQKCIRYKEFILLLNAHLTWLCKVPP